jgi:ubiquinone/menaquinone biosynthesis C-methylase UbiE
MNYNYDDEVKKYNSYSHNVIFGMCYDLVKPGEKILDLGIGTGLASIQFYKMGLRVYCIDNSSEMLNICRKKAFAEELKLYDLNGIKIPYDDDFFNHIVCCGVLHFFAGVEKIFSEAARLIKRGGIFAFTFAPCEKADKYTEEMSEWGIPVYKHSSGYIKCLLSKNNMNLLKEQRLLMKGADKLNYDNCFSAVIAEYQ